MTRPPSAVTVQHLVHTVPCYRVQSGLRSTLSMSPHSQRQEAERRGIVRTSNAHDRELETAYGTQMISAFNPAGFWRRRRFSASKLLFSLGKKKGERRDRVNRIHRRHRPRGSCHGDRCRRDLRSMRRYIPPHRPSSSISGPAGTNRGRITSSSCCRALRCSSCCSSLSSLIERGYAKS